MSLPGRKPNKSTIRVAELREFVYCPRSWIYNARKVQCKLPPEEIAVVEQRLEDGWQHHREALASHVVQAWLGRQGSPKNIANLISLRGCVILAGKVNKPEAQIVQAAFATLQASISQTNQEKNMSQADAKKQEMQAAAEVNSEDAQSQAADAANGTTDSLPVQAEPETEALTDTLLVVDGPVKVVEFHSKMVPVFEVNGEFFLTGEDLGNILGFAEPGSALRKIFERNQDELRELTCRVKLTRQGDNQKREVRLYSQDACYLVTMFARTEKAKEVRQWLAALPRKIRQAQEATPEILARVKEYFFNEIVPRIFHLLSTPVGIKLGYKNMERLTQLRSCGLITQKEAARLYDISVESVRTIEREMATILGLEIKPMNQYQRDRQISKAIEQFVEMRSSHAAMAAAAPRDRKKMH